MAIDGQGLLRLAARGSTGGLPSRAGIGDAAPSGYLCKKGHPLHHGLWRALPLLGAAQFRLQRRHIAFETVNMRLHLKGVAIFMSPCFLQFCSGIGELS